MTAGWQSEDTTGRPVREWPRASDAAHGLGESAAEKIGELTQVLRLAAVNHQWLLAEGSQPYYQVCDTDEEPESACPFRNERAEVKQVGCVFEAMPA